MIAAVPPTPVLSRLVEVDDLPAAGLAVTVTPDAAERAALARLNGLVELKAMTATLRLRAEPGGGVRATGEVAAEVTQTCVVSLEPFDTAVREPVNVEFLPPAALAAHRAARAKRGVVLDEEPPPEEPDPIVNGRIDAGALAAEHLTLGLDPYPRKPGAELPPVISAGDPAVSPFAVLRQRRGDAS